MGKAYRVIDADGHILERAEDMEPYGRVWGLSEKTDRLLARNSPEQWRSGITALATEGVFDPAARLKDMDLEGVDVAVGFPTVFLGVSDLRPEDSVEACRTYNDWFHGFYHGFSQERFALPAMVPLNDPEAAAAEAERAITQLGACAIFIQPYAGDRRLDDAAYDPMYAVMQKHGVPLCIHGGRGTTEPLFAGSSFRTQMRYHVMAHPWQQQTAMADLVCGGVLERHPDLKVAFLESGIGWVPWFTERLDQDFKRMPQDEQLKHGKPSDYLKSGNCFFSCDPDEPMIPWVADMMGEDTIIYASDYPHWDCRFPESVRLIAENESIPERLKQKVLGENATRLYRL